jgi:(R,R)-butanediol dehydrogenase/meso-butanediol dehydrogenase/diacetyl reductase
VRALVWHGRGDVRVRDVPPPAAPRADEVTVAVEWCGICGTDVDEWRHGPRLVPTEPHPLTGRMAPLVLGHEVAGRVSAVGRGVDFLREGDLVALDANVSCGQCWWCARHEVTLCPNLAAIGLQMDGGLAEAVTVPARMCLPVPKGVEAETAALAEPLAVAVRALRKGDVRVGTSLVVVGGGMIGAATVAAARAAGAQQIAVVEPDAARRALALRLGADAAVAPADAVDLPHADVVVDAVGLGETVAQSLCLARSGGRVVVVGLSGDRMSFDIQPFVASEKELVGSLSHVWDEDFAAAVRLLGDGVLRAEDVVAQRLPLEEAVERGFESPDYGSGVKILVSPKL